jgi:hypothetical protein
MSLLVVVVCMDPRIHVVLNSGASIYDVLTLNEYYVLIFHFHFHKNLSFYFVTNVLSMSVQ